MREASALTRTLAGAGGQSGLLIDRDSDSAEGSARPWYRLFAVDERKGKENFPSCFHPWWRGGA